MGISHVTTYQKAVVQIDREPSACPVCHHAVSPTRLSSSNYDKDLEVVFLCPHNKCNRLFIGRYTYHTGLGKYKLAETVPRVPREEQFSPEIQEVSSSFQEIYNQVLAAEAAGLDQLAGMGLRKAFEFLVKDFAAAQHPDDAERIRAMTLGACIKAYMDNTRLQEVAERAVWLGNDETHYVRLWQNKDITDLKVLIRLSVNLVETVLISDRYIEDMPDQRKTK